MSLEFRCLDGVRYWVAICVLSAIRLIIVSVSLDHWCVGALPRGFDLTASMLITNVPSQNLNRLIRATLELGWQQLNDREGQSYLGYNRASST